MEKTCLTIAKQTGEAQDKVEALLPLMELMALHLLKILTLIKI